MKRSISFEKLTQAMPRPHLYAIALVSLLSASCLFLLPAQTRLSPAKTRLATALNSDSGEEDTDINRYPALAKANPATDFGNVPDNVLISDDADLVSQLHAKAANQHTWLNYQIKSDDNLAGVFETLNISATRLPALIAADSHHWLEHLRENQSLAFEIDANDNLTRLVVSVGQNHNQLFELQGSRFITRDVTDSYLGNQEEDDVVEAATPDATHTSLVQAKPEQKHSEAKPPRIISANVTDSFVSSTKRAGLIDRKILGIINIFKGRVDFHRDIHKGDHFKILFDRPYADDAKILAVVLTLNGKDYRAYKYVNHEFYDENASNLTSGTFLRYPTNAHVRISSPFSPTRKNPVTGRIQPHNGTDFAVPVGTPVVATGDGVVIKATTNPSTGRYVVLRHNAKYTTVYMHMSKLLVKVGQKVHQNQPIGLAGNTGRSTGPHIHYEFRIDNHPVNAMRIDLPVENSSLVHKKQQFIDRVKQYNKLLAGV